MRRRSCRSRGLLLAPGEPIVLAPRSVVYPAICVSLSARPHRLLRPQKVTHLLVQGLGVLDPETELVTVTPVPEGVKFTAPGPSVTFVYAAVTCDDAIPSMTTLSRVTLFRCDVS